MSLNKKNKAVAPAKNPKIKPVVTTSAFTLAQEPVTPTEPAQMPEAAPVMQPNYLMRMLYIMIPIVIIGFLIISISLTFGDSDAGIAVGVLEGCLILVAGLVVVYLPVISAFYNKTMGKKLKERKAAKNAK